MALSFIKSSGNIITEDFCSALANETKADYVKDKSFGSEMKKVDDVIASTFEKLRERWEENRTQILSNNLDNSNLRNKWILPLLKTLDYQPVFISSNIKSGSGTEYQIPYKGWDSEYAPLIHMVPFTQDLDTKDKHSRTHANKSPQDCLQQFLNTSHHQWAILINGKKVRILRDFYHSITKGFLEFDLESIFETASSEQFRVLFRILHRSRIENQYQGSQEIEYDENGIPIETEDNCLLEFFHKKSRETGIKIGNKLRDQVIETIETLGNGFAETLNPDEFQNGKVKAYYAEILNVIYRLLFLMFAEQKGWLPVRNTIYARTYSLNALREMTEKGNYGHDDENDLWEGLKITFRLVTHGYCFKNGDTINAFGGQLFSDKKIATINGLSLKNKHLLDAIYRLSYFKLDNLSNRINYANLAIDELGSVYESLLDYEPKLAIESATLGKREIKRGEFYLDDRGTDRKTTGSYYTDSRLVAQLIESALVPIINSALANKISLKEKEEALLNLKVADIACGSGAFICAALEKMGEQLSLIRMGEEERPTEDQLREAKRDVLLHCIYGVDLNPMALDLAKFSLWITASLPDMPLTFLDHKLKCGNSLIGATPDLINKGIPEEAYKPVGNDNATICAELKKRVRKQQESLSIAAEPSAQYGLKFKKNESDELLRLREVLINRKQEEVADVDLAEEEYHNLEKLERKFKDWLMADVWTAAFFVEKTEIDLELYPTNVTLENLRENQPIKPELIENILKIADHFNFFHFHLEFPEVFEKGGFDCLLGNPPWERIRLQEQEFFRGKNDKIANADKAQRARQIESLKESNKPLYNEFRAALNEKGKLINFISNSDKFPLLGNGDLNTFSVFTENFTNNISKSGRFGIIVPSEIATGDGCKDYFSFIINERRLVSLFDFINSKGIFQHVHKGEKFCLLTVSGNVSLIPIVFAFHLTDPNQLNDTERKYELSSEDINVINPNTSNCPLFKTAYDAFLVKKIYKNSTILINDITEENPYSVRFSKTFDSANAIDRKLLLNKELLQNNGFTLRGNFFINKEGNRYMPVYEGKMIGIYNSRSAKVEINEDNAVRKAQASYSAISDLTNLSYSPTPQYWIDENIISSLGNIKEWVIAIRKNTAATNSRTLISSIVPNYGMLYSFNVITSNESDAETLSVLYSSFNSYVLDYVVRNKIGGENIAKFIIKQLPVVRIPSRTTKTFRTIVSNVIRLTYNFTDLAPFAMDVNYEYPPIKWNDKERFQLQCELDAIYAHLYGLEKMEMDYILETFPIIKRKDIVKYGSYRTKETILQLYDEFAWINEEMKQQTIKTEQA